MIPKMLKKGDTIGVIRTSEPITNERNGELISSTKFLEDLGFKVKLGKFLRDNELGYGTSAKNKALGINEMFQDEEVKAILCACGGENVNSVFDYLDFDLIKNNPKIICGYSDPTSLLNAIYLKTGLVTFHGANFTSLSEEFKGEAEYTRNEFIKRFIEGNLQLGAEKNEFITIKEGQGEGILVGGNLSLISRFSAGKYSIDFNDKILFIEELFCETPPALASSYLYYMKQNDVFKKIKGLWIGNYLSEISLEKIVLDVLEDEKYKFPIIKSNNFGHIDKKITIPIGIRARIDTNRKEKIELMEECVSR